MDIRRAASIARSVGWLTRTGVEFQDRLLQRCDVVRFGRGEMIYNSGDAAGGLFCVVEGSIEIHIPSAKGQPSLGYLAGIGFWAGDVAAILGRPRRVSLWAATPCALLRLSRPDLAQVADRFPDGWRYMAELLAINLGIALDTIDALKRNDPVERVAMTLLNLLDGGSASADRLVSISQADIASLAQMSRSSASTALGELQRRGWIRRSYTAISVTDRPALEDFLRGD